MYIYIFIERCTFNSTDVLREKLFDVGMEMMKLLSLFSPAHTLLGLFYIVKKERTHACA